MNLEYGFLTLILIMCVLWYMEISKLKLQVRQLQLQIEKLYQITKNEQSSALHISDEIKHRLLELKKKQKIVAAVKLLRETTSMSLVEAKAYIDEL